MKRIITCLFLALIAVTAFCQIQDTFFNCQLGKTTMDQLKTNLSNQGYEYNVIIDQGETRIYIINCRYSGEQWEAITLQFYKDIFYEIVFMKMSDDEEEIEKQFNLYETIFDTKYSDFHMDEEYVHSRDGARRTEMYSDYYNDILLKLEHIVLKFETLLLTYTDFNISQQKLFEGLGSY